MACLNRSSVNSKEFSSVCLFLDQAGPTRCYKSGFRVQWVVQLAKPAGWVEIATFCHHSCRMGCTRHQSGRSRCAQPPRTLFPAGRRSSAAARTPWLRVLGGTAQQRHVNTSRKTEWECSQQQELSFQEGKQIYMCIFQVSRKMGAEKGKG